MLEKLVAQRRPGTAEHAAAAGDAERAGLEPVAGQICDRVAHRPQVAGFVQPSVDAVVHEIERPATAGRHDRDAAGESFLDSLAERLALARVNEDIQTRDGLARDPFRPESR